MRISAITIWSLFCLLTSLNIQAQPNKYGVPLITNYPYGETKGDEQNWCVTQDHRGVVYVGNQRKGILEYDGVEWRTISVPHNAAVYSMVTGDDGVVYVGASSDFGRLEPDNNGQLIYHSFTDSIVDSRFPEYAVWRTYFHDNQVYFCSGSAVFIYSIVDDNLTILETPESGFFSYLVDTTLYHSNFIIGLMHLKGDEFVSIKGGDYFSEMSIMGMVRYDANHLLIGTQFKGLYLFNPETGNVNDAFIDAELTENFESVFITYIASLGENFLVCTVSGGLYVLNPDGEVESIISENEGLINPTISHVYTDKRLNESGALWITHFEGVSKIEANNPFGLFPENSGFEGLIHDVAEFNGTLFVATSQGLFYKSNAGFIPVEGVYGQIWDLQMIEPSPNQKFLLATSSVEFFIIDKWLNIKFLQEEVRNPPRDYRDEEQYSGRMILTDPNRPDVIYVGNDQLVGLQYKRGKWREILRFHDLELDIYEMILDKYGYIWISALYEIIRIDVSVAQEPTMRTYTAKNGLPFDEGNMVFLDPENHEVLIGTVDDFYRYDYFLDTIKYDSLFSGPLPAGNNVIQAFHQDKDGDYWFSFENQFNGNTELVAQKSNNQFSVIHEKPFLRLPVGSVDVFFDDDESGVWFSKSYELYHFDKTFTRNDSIPFHALIRKVVIDKGDSILYSGCSFRSNPFGGYSIHLFQEEDTQPILKYKYNNIEFNWAAPYFEQEKQLQFSYKLEEFTNSWSEWSDATHKEFTNLKYGKYTFEVKALNVYGDESESARYSFTISRPWYASIPAIIAYILLSGLLVYLIIKIYTRRLKLENLRLEGIIEERTAEIRKQKEELTDSIEYASRIQRALLPSHQLMDDHNVDHFILFRPRDIVSGDFYWMGCKKDKMLIVAADCTGHGVPGAFMSMLGMTFLDEIVIKSEVTNTNEIMDSLRAHVIASLEQSGKSMDDVVKDGMDLAMLSIDMKSNMIQYSGAYNPLYLVRKLKRSEKTKISKGEDLELPRGSIHDDEHLLIHHRADQMPIGVSEKDMPFTSTTIKDDGYNIYIFSDGFLDQFGGPQGKKFMSKNFKKLLLELQSVPLNEQGAALEKVLLGWMGEISQIDDILVMGLRINPV